MPKPSFDDLKNFGRTGQNGTNGHQSPSTLRLAITRKLSDIEPEALEWDWRGRIPKGKLTLIVGDPGLGKSILTTHIVACVTTGRAWPDDPPGTMRAPRRVIWLSAEDAAGDTIRPRIDAAGGNGELVTMLEGIREVEIDEFVDPEGGPSAARKERETEFSMARDIPVLQQVITAEGASLVIVDPLTAYLGDADSFKDAEVRSVLRPLAELAARYGVTVIAVMHLNKAVGKVAQYRVSGSVAFVAAARAVHLVAVDPDDKDKRVFLPVKQNLSKAPDGLKFRLESYPMLYANGPADPARVVWLDEAVTTSTEDALDNEWTGGAMAEAMSFLRETLGAGAALVEDLEREAREAGVSLATLRRACEKLHVRRRKLKKHEHSGTPWVAYLPNEEGDHAANLAQHGYVGQVGEHEQVGGIDVIPPKETLLAMSLPIQGSHVPQHSQDAQDLQDRARDQLIEDDNSEVAF